MRSDRHWEVGGSLPPEEGRNWRKNVVLHIVTATVERALVLARVKHPELMIHRVEHRGQLDIIDDQSDQVDSPG